MNFFKTLFLLTALTLLLVFAGGALGGQQGMMTALVFACVMNLGAYWFSDKIVLAMYRAQALSESDAPAVYRIVRELTEKAGMPMPRIFRIPSEAPNAFATGRNPRHAVVAVTEGILRLLEEEELKGVLGHELAHVQHRDILIASVAATIAGAVSMLSSMARWALMFGGGRRSDREGGANPLVLLITAIVAPFAALLIQLAVSRSREFGADEGGAQLAGNPLGLASALRKLDAGSRRTPMVEANPTTAHLFIVNPLRGGGIVKLFSTHPPVEERIERLERLSRSPKLGPH
ncbi:MAG: zinc metalloprotease HtpX [Candidatus Omnitrophica bacterium]|nr:zinc metalloprotease HtpX [Candidatus Omnitrophota bacterium]